MRHNWVRVSKTDVSEYFKGAKRVCANCGAVQYLSCVSYDIMNGGEYRWKPPAGRCAQNIKENNV